jgi:hypothetical protein
MKSRIIKELGQQELILPSLIAGALKANDRAKRRMSVLQAAAEHAHDPHGTPPDLAAECGRTGIDAAATRTLVARARTNGGGLIEAPGLAKLNEALLSDVRTMIEPVRAGDAAAGEAPEQRLASLSAGLDLANERMPETTIARFTAVYDGKTDSLHRLVMDLHKALNLLTAQCAESNVAGALTSARSRVTGDSLSGGGGSPRGYRGSLL